MNQSRESRQARRLTMLEAALYTAGRPIELEHLRRFVRTSSERVVKRLVRELAKRYEARGSALEIKELPDNRVILQLKTDFADLVRRFTRRPLLTRGPLKTLSYVAYHQPVEQVRVVVDRGSHVYSHLRMMEGLGLITREKEGGKCFIIRTTPYFADYFGFSHSPLKSRLQLRMMFNRLKITKLDNGDERAAGEVLTVPQLPAELLADAGDGLPEGLAEYPSTTNQGSE